MCYQKKSVEVCRQNQKRGKTNRPSRVFENTNAHAQKSSEPWQLSFPVNNYLVFFVSEGNAVGYTTISFLQVATCTFFIICLQRYE
jgi:hypothetical protein